MYAISDPSSNWNYSHYSHTKDEKESTKTSLSFPFHLFEGLLVELAYSFLFYSRSFKPYFRRGFDSIKN